MSTRIKHIVGHVDGGEGMLDVTRFCGAEKTSHDGDRVRVQLLVSDNDFDYNAIALDRQQATILVGALHTAFGQL